MSWRIAQKNGLYRIWSTISDEWLTDWISRKEAIQFYYDDMLVDFKKRIIEKYKSFPNHCNSHDEPNTLITDKEGYQEYMAWLHKLGNTKNADEYYALIDEEFSKIMADLDKAGPTQ